MNLVNITVRLSSGNGNQGQVMEQLPNFEEFQRPAKVSIMARMRGWFFTGLLVTAPVMLTIYITWLFIDIIDAQVMGLIPSGLRDYITLQAPLIGKIPGLGLLVGLVVITLIGALAAGFFGRWLIRLGENILNRMPVIRSIYGATKQIFETVLSAQSNAFREVVLVEYPRTGLWVIGFVTGTTRGEVQESIPRETVNVFIPTTPNPTSGFLLFCPHKELVYLKMSVEDAVKLVVSGGIVAPPSPAASLAASPAASSTASGAVTKPKTGAKKAAKTAVKTKAARSQSSRPRKSRT